MSIPDSGLQAPRRHRSRPKWLWSQGLRELFAIAGVALPRVTAAVARLGSRKNSQQRRALLFMRWLLVCVGCLITRTGFAVDPVEELKSFSRFQTVDFQKLADGEILLSRGPLMDFPRGLTAQACFIAMAPASKAAHLYQTWEVSNNEEMTNIYFHGAVHNPPSDDDFKELNFNVSKLRWLADKTSTVAPGRSDLYLSRAEAAKIHACIKAKGDSLDVKVSFWKEVLKARALEFQQNGLSGVHPYDTETEGVFISPQSEIESILKERPKIKEQFAPLIEEGPLVKPTSNARIEPYFYWDLVDINAHPTFNLGAIYLRPISEGRYQVLDLDYYSSGGLYVSATFRQIWPVKIRGKEVTLVWRGEEVSAPDLVGIHGIERVAAGALMLQEIKKSVRAFQEDILKVP